MKRTTLVILAAVIIIVLIIGTRLQVDNDIPAGGMEDEVGAGIDGTMTEAESN